MYVCFIIYQVAQINVSPESLVFLPIFMYLTYKRVSIILYICICRVDSYI